MSDLGPVTAVRQDVSSVLAQMRTMRSEITAELAAPERLDAATRATDKASAPERTDFGQVLGNALSTVNAFQQDSGAKAAAFSRGETDDLVGVMVASQKSSVAFQAALQVRNRMVSAYQDIMNMPI